MLVLKAATVLGFGFMAGGCVTERIVYYPVPANQTAAVQTPAAPPPQPVMVINEGPPAVRSGQVLLADMSDSTLEILVCDLNDRKDKAIKLHDGAPSPEAEHLWRVLGDVRAEFSRRGYTFDAEGNCFRGDRPVKLWWDDQTRPK